VYRYVVFVLSEAVQGLMRGNAVNGIPKGEGKGSSKQTAKEEAARQAFYAMGWT
jgi:dsRNA-specific ribonuclease